MHTTLNSLHIVLYHALYSKTCILSFEMHAPSVRHFTTSAKKWQNMLHAIYTNLQNTKPKTIIYSNYYIIIAVRYVSYILCDMNHLCGERMVDRSSFDWIKIFVHILCLSSVHLTSPNHHMSIPFIIYMHSKTKTI